MASRRKNVPENFVGFEGRTVEQRRLALRKKVRIFYDLQRLRMQVEGRTTEKAKGAEIQLHAGDIQILGARSLEMETAEKNALKDIEDHLKETPFYVSVLSDKTVYRGIGPTMAGVILSEFDINRADTVSDFWKYAGLAPIPAMRCKACQALVKSEDSDGAISYSHRGALTEKKCTVKQLTSEQLFESGESMRPTKGEKLPYNAFLKMKLIGVLAPVLLKVSSPWTKQYYDYKHRKQTQNWGMSDGHRHNAAMRYMIKIMLMKIHLDWRNFENLPIRASYHEEKQGGHGYSNNNSPGDITNHERY